MGTTRIKIIDLASDQKEIKTSRKHAEKLSAVSYIKKVKPQKKKKQKEEIQKQTVRTPADVLADSDKPKQIEKTDDVKKDLPEIEAQKNTSKKESQKHRHLGKKYNQAASLIDKNKLYNIKEAIDLLHKTSYVKFDPTVEIHLNVKDKNIKGSVNLPHPVAQKKQRQYLVFVDKKIESDKDIILGNEATITQIQEGKLKIYGGKQYRPILHVHDAAQAIIDNITTKHTGIYNLHKQNVKIADLAEEIQKHFPRLKVEKVDMKFEDLRNYRVSSDKAKKAFGFSPKLTSSDGILELKKILDEGRIKDLDNPLYTNQAYLTKCGAHRQYPEKEWM